jgi:hypothetical protein
MLAEYEKRLKGFKILEVECITTQTLKERT